jgi:hypothetical protein
LPCARPPTSAAGFISLCAFAFAGFAELLSFELELDLATLIEVVEAEGDLVDLWRTLLDLASLSLGLALAKHVSKEIAHIEGYTTRESWKALRRFLDLRI